MILHDAFHANGRSPPPVLTKLLHCCQGNCVLLLSLSHSFSLSCTRNRHGAFEWNVVLACSCTLENFHKAAHFVNQNWMYSCEFWDKQIRRRVFALKACMLCFLQVQTLLQQMQDKFQTMSDQIIGRNILHFWFKKCHWNSLPTKKICKLHIWGFPSKMVL